MIEIFRAEGKKSQNSSRHEDLRKNYFWKKLFPYSHLFVPKKISDPNQISWIFFVKFKTEERKDFFFLFLYSDNLQRQRNSLSLAQFLKANPFWGKLYHITLLRLFLHSFSVKLNFLGTKVFQRRNKQIFDYFFKKFQCKSPNFQRSQRQKPFFREYKKFSFPLIIWS